MSQIRDAKCQTFPVNRDNCIAFTGDFRLWRSENAAAGSIQVSSEIKGSLDRCEHVVVNLEGPITTRPSVVPKGVTLRSSHHAIEVLKELHCTTLNLGNNHVFDHGLEGYRETQDTVRQHGWRSFGAGENRKDAAAPVILPLKGGHVGLIAVCDYWPDKMATDQLPGVFCHTSSQEIKQRLVKLHEQCRWVGINYHGGEELFHMPMPSRRRRLLEYVQAGADFVIAHHATWFKGTSCCEECRYFTALVISCLMWNISAQCLRWMNPSL